ncbi:MAG TPA: hypothetical protein VFC78_06005 [Tepidisphaeraceae bacterium]|nr:hypothetical protein [Tepidisphaeraceae bacterium]
MGDTSTPIARRKLAVHGPVVELDCTVPALAPALDLLLGAFAVPGWPDGFGATAGSVRPYEQAEVLRCLSSSARHAGRTPDMMDVYEEDERFWLVDDRWGMSEINILKGQWRSWVVPQPKLDMLRVAELAVLWPMAQLLRARGLHLLPAVSAVRDGFAVLLICPFGIEPELTGMIAAGFKIIGQRWTGVREEDGRLALLHLPGRIDRATVPRLRSTMSDQESCFDVTAESPGSWQNHAFCDAVLVAEPGRRPKAHLRQCESGAAINVLRRAWPILELHPNRRSSQLPSRLAQGCRCYELQLSRNPKDLLALLNSLRYTVHAPGEEHSEAA